ncbi:MAG: KOW domain-containing RNA-binding protein [Bacillota bacterium]|nr:KOW domain-containing RNA-binding protein [Bacillota bacterium]MDW7676944.1 KOW domain-containing RNA-binding protein [Bacillota bacterium]
MKQEPLQIGQIVRSIQGRDKGRCMVLIDVLDDEYALLVDGRLRRLDKPKKKKRKHFVSEGLVSEEIRQRITLEKKMNNALIRVELERLTEDKPGANGG